MSQYMISVWHEEDYELDFSEPDAQCRVAQVESYNAKLVDDDALVFAAGLQPRATAVVMRPTDGEVLAVDGPFVESKEHIGGFWIIEAPNLDDARHLAREAAAACEQSVELRALQGE